MQSDFALPELSPGSGNAAPDVVIRHVAALPPADGPLTAMTPRAFTDAREFRLETAEGVFFRVTDGRLIEVQTPAAIDAGTVRAHLLGSAIGALLHQRGLLPLHASAVDLGGRAVAMLGASGAGKSTLALHFGRAAHRVLCDDICAVDLLGDAPVVWPGVRHLKLWRQSLTAIGAEPTGLRQVAAGDDKYHWPLGAAEVDAPVPLVALLVLEQGGTVTLAPMAGAEAVSAIVGNTYRGLLVHPMGAGARHLVACSSLARTAGVFRLTRPWGMEHLAGVVDAVERAAGG